MESFESPKGLPFDFEKLVDEGSAAELSLDHTFPVMPADFKIDFHEYFEFCGDNPDSGPEIMKKFLEKKLAEIHRAN